MRIVAKFFHKKLHKEVLERQLWDSPAPDSFCAQKFLPLLFPGEVPTSAYLRK